jgi:hypothetical protein
MFVWSPIETSDVSWEVSEHTLNIKLVKQALQHFNQEKHQGMDEELSRLLATSFVKEIQHLDWIANPVLVPKKNGKWRMCVDYKSLNKACSNDPFPLPHIDQVVDLIVGCDLLSFLDACSGYHQIPLAEEDQPATTFITPFNGFCCMKMSFGLKNTGATYQRCMLFFFRGQIGCSLEVYIDHIIVKSQKCSSLIYDLEETFNNLRRFNNKLNLEKCTFRVHRGKLLGYIITECGIKVNLNKISAIDEMGQVRNIKDVQ